MPTVLTDIPMHKQYVHLEIYNLYSLLYFWEKGRLSMHGYPCSYIRWERFSSRCEGMKLHQLVSVPSYAVDQLSSKHGPQIRSIIVTWDFLEMHFLGPQPWPVNLKPWGGSLPSAFWWAFRCESHCCRLKPLPPGPKHTALWACGRPSPTVTAWRQCPPLNQSCQCSEATSTRCRAQAGPTFGVHDVGTCVNNSLRSRKNWGVIFSDISALLSV